MTDERCTKCGGTMEMHYGLWCPMCDKPEPETRRVFDFFRVATYIAAHEGYEYANGADDNWYRKVLGDIDFPGNDCYVMWTIETTTFPHHEQFNDGLKKYFSVTDEEEIILNISW